MQARFSFSAEIASAVGLNSAPDRLAALRRVARDLAGIPLSQHDSWNNQVNPCAALHRQNLAKAFQRLRDLAPCAPAGELDLVAYAQAGERELVICALAEISHFSPDTVAGFLASDRPCLMLLVCRMQNFAWSSVKLVLMLCQQPPGQALDEDWLCDEYHRTPIRLAQRFCRFLQIHHHPILKLGQHAQHRIHVSSPISTDETSDRIAGDLA